MSRRKREFKRVVAVSDLHCALAEGEFCSPILGYEGLYAVTSLGRVWSCSRTDRVGRRIGGRFLVGKRIGRDRDHLCVCLLRDGRAKYLQIHRLVAEHFIPNPHGKPTVNHINGVQNDNRIENLEWATYPENQSHAWDTGLCKVTKPKLTAVQANAARVFRENGLSYHAIGKLFNVDAKCIWQIVMGKTYKEALA